MTVGSRTWCGLLNQGLYMGECIFTFRIFTWVDSRASCLAQESVGMIQQGYLLRAIQHHIQDHTSRFSTNLITNQKHVHFPVHSELSNQRGSGDIERCVVFSSGLRLDQ